MIRRSITLCMLFTCAVARADVVTTTDGARLVGTVQKMTPKLIELKTGYAGVLSIAMDQVTEVTTAAPITTRFSDDTTVTGVTRLTPDKTIEISGTHLQTSAALADLKASWLPDATPPPESGYDPRRWLYTLSVDVTGKRGNTEESNNRFSGELALVTKRDELKMYGSYEKDKTDNETTADESILGASYTAYTAGIWGWYVRGELERDQFEDIDLRSTVAGGLSLRPVNSETRMLQLFAGLGYRHESYKSDVESDNSTTLDFGVNHRWILKPWLTMLNNLTYEPAIDDFGNYLLTQDSSLEMPIGASRWLIRLGVSNEYNSEPAPGFDELDTTYYTRVLVRAQ
jgi:Protein of unknown function, DUF481